MSRLLPKFTSRAMVSVVRAFPDNCKRLALDFLNPLARGANDELLHISTVIRIDSNESLANEPDEKLQPTSL